MAATSARIKQPLPHATPRAQTTKVLPLINGDRLTRAEFERRYEAMPEVKAELIEGVVYMSSPVRLPHSECTGRIVTWLGVYQAATPGVGCSDNGTVRLDADNEPQPDAALWLNEGGATRVSPDLYLEGAPELVVEVAFSSAAYDLTTKLQAYRRNGVQEYLVWQLAERRLDWFRLQAGEYVRVKPDKRGVIESAVFPGLRLKVKALLADKMNEVLAELQQGVATPAHAAFVTQLTGKKRRSSKARRRAAR